MPEYERLDGESGCSWRAFTSLEKKLTILTTVLAVVIFILALALALHKCEAPTPVTTVGPTSSVTPTSKSPTESSSSSPTGSSSSSSTESSSASPPTKSTESSSASPTESSSTSSVTGSTASSVIPLVTTDVKGSKVSSDEKAFGAVASSIKANPATGSTEEPKV